MKVLSERQNSAAFGSAPALVRAIERPLAEVSADVFQAFAGVNAVAKKTAADVVIDVIPSFIAERVFPVRSALHHSVVSGLNIETRPLLTTPKNKGIASISENCMDRKSMADFLSEIKETISGYANNIRASVHHAFNYIHGGCGKVSEFSKLDYIQRNTQRACGELSRDLRSNGFLVSGIKYNHSQSGSRIATFDIDMMKKTAGKFKLILFRDIIDGNKNAIALLRKWGIEGNVHLSDKENGYALVEVAKAAI